MKRLKQTTRFQKQQVSKTKLEPSSHTTPTTRSDHVAVYTKIPLAASLHGRRIFDVPIIISKMTEDRVKRVLITGAAGFIGSHVAETLLRRGDYVIIVDDMNDYYDTRLKLYNLSIIKSCYPSNSFAIYTGDIVDRQFMTEIFEKEKPTHVCHLAARAGVRPSISDPYIYVRTNIEGTTCLLDLSRSYGIENFVYASSSSVYGGSDKESLSEDDVINKPVSPYAATKATCELLAHTYYHLYGMNSIGLRFFTVYGPRGRPDMAPFKFIDRIIRGIPIQQYGDGSSSRDYTYISDIVDGVVRSLDRPMGCEVINLGNGNPFLLKNFIEIVERAVGKKAVIEYLPEQPGDVERTCANVTKARMLLDYNPQVRLLFHSSSLTSSPIGFL
jgi:UDP-glucuronate 4-epimerase